jgi:hypothetical protein
MIARGLLAATLALPVLAVAQDCADVGQRALRESVGLHPPLQAKVGGEGRVYFHRAPDAGCRERGLFVVPGDHLVALTPWGQWIQVRYTARDGTRHVTWLEASRVRLSEHPAL